MCVKLVHMAPQWSLKKEKVDESVWFGIPNAFQSSSLSNPSLMVVCIYSDAQGSKCELKVRNGAVFDGIFKTYGPEVSQSWQAWRDRRTNRSTLCVVCHKPAVDNVGIAWLWRSIATMLHNISAMSDANHSQNYISHFFSLALWVALADTHLSVFYFMMYWHQVSVLGFWYLTVPC